jgi:hypothetical protein
MAIYLKDKSFSVGWTIGGTVLMFITNLGGGFAAGLAGITSIYAMAGLGALCFALGGFIIGWKSEGQTILEAGLAAALATAITVSVRGALGSLIMQPVALVIGLGIPFAAGVLGGWIGEKVQGDTVGSDD